MKPELVGGRNAALACLEAKRRRVHRVYLLDRAQGIEAIESATRGIPIQRCDRAALDKRSDGLAHQGVLLEADPLPVQTPEEWLQNALPPDALVLILDGVQDPQNFGAIIRTAVAFGAHAIVYPKDRAAPLSPAAVKAAAGAAEYATFIKATNLSRTIELLKEQGVWVAALDSEGGEVPWSCDLKRPLALVTGGEGKGIRPLVRKHCDFRLTFPLSGPMPSLNASVATAVILAEVLRQRHK